MMTFQNNFKNGCLFILLAALMDRYDGRVARFLNVSSELGKELDSLADLVCVWCSTIYINIQYV